MSFSNAFETELLDLIFNNANIANLGDVTGVQASTADGSLYVSLHTADPGEAGNQSTNEISYTGYGRAAVARTTGGWTVSGNQVQNTAAVTFGACTAGSGTATYFGIGLESTGATVLLCSGQITSPGGGLVISAGITPEFAINAITATLA